MFKHKIENKVKRKGGELRQLYHMCLNCFSLYADHCNLIDYMLRGFILFVSSNLNPSWIFMYISLFMDPYKYALTASVRLTSSISETVMAFSYKCLFVPNKLYTFRHLDYMSKTSCFINNCNSACIAFSILANNFFFSILSHFVVWDLHHFV